MGRILNQTKYPLDATVTINDYVIGTDGDDPKKITRNYRIGDILALAVGAGGVDTFSTLNGNILTLPDGQTFDLTHTIDTDTDTFASISGGVITFADGQTVDLSTLDTDTFATLNGTILTLPDGQTYDLAQEVGGDPDKFATLSGNTITFSDGQTIVVPAASTDDQTAAEVAFTPSNIIITSTNVQGAINQLESHVNGLAGGVGDDWGSQVVLSDSTLGGNGTTDNELTVTIPAQDDGVEILSAFSALNFTGAGVTVTNNGGVADINISGGGAGGATQLSELSDVNTSTPTNRNILVADGTDWESRPLVEADISDFGTYDNYQSFNLKTDGAQRTTVQSGGDVDLVGTANEINLSYSAGGVVTFNLEDRGQVVSLGSGYTLRGKSGANYGTLGLNAVNLSTADFVNNHGATGSYTFAAGYDVIASGNFGSAAIGSVVTVSGSSAFGAGSGVTVSGETGAGFGNSINISGDRAFGAGNNLVGASYAGVYFGQFNTQPSVTSDSWVTTEPLFTIGIGTSGGDLRDGFVLRKDGRLQLNEYGSNVFTGTETRLAGFDANGVLIEIDPASYGGGGGGSSTFLGLTDVNEPDYTGHGGQIPFVNLVATEVQFSPLTIADTGGGEFGLSGVKNLDLTSGAQSSIDMTSGVIGTVSLINMTPPSPASGVISWGAGNTYIDGQQLRTYLLSDLSDTMAIELGASDIIIGSTAAPSTNITLFGFGQGNKSGTEVYGLGVNNLGNIIEIPLGGGGGASQLSDLSDVSSSTPALNNFLIADGSNFVSRAANADDIVVDDSGFLALQGTDVQSLIAFADVGFARARVTGLKAGFTVAINADPTLFDLSAIVGEINNVNGYYGINYAGATEITVTNIAAPSTWVYIDDTGVVGQQTTNPTPQERRDKAYIARFASNGTNLVAFEYDYTPTNQGDNSLKDLVEILKVNDIPLFTGFTITPNANLSFQRSAGNLLEIGSTDDEFNPNLLPLLIANPANLFILDRSTTLASAVTDINVTQYDNNGTPTNLTNNRFVGHRLYLFGSGNHILQLGQAQYGTIQDAKAGIQNENYIENPAVANGDFLGWWIVQEGETDLQDAVANGRAEFIQRSIGGGFTSGSAIGTLLAANNLSDLSNVATARTNLGLDAVGIESLLDAYYGNDDFWRTQPTAAEIETLLDAYYGNTVWRTHGAGGSSEGKIYNELLTSQLDGSNKVFSIANEYVSGSTEVYLNGVKLTLTDDYTESGVQQITLTGAQDAPAATEELTITYATSTGGITEANNYNENLTSQVDGTATVFTTTSSYVATSTRVYLNGQKLTLIDDYTESGAGEITFGTAPEVGDVVTIAYSTSAPSGGSGNTLVPNESFTGDGTTATFTLSGNFQSGSTMVYKGGLRMRLGATNDYEETAANEITFNAGQIPANSENIVIDYIAQ